MSNSVLSILQKLTDLIFTMQFENWHYYPDFSHNGNRYHEVELLVHDYYEALLILLIY